MVSSINMNDRPTLALLIPFASRQVKSKWNIACAHLRQTLGSIQNSSSGNYCVVVAGHEPPEFDVSFDSRFHFLSLNHPIPSDHNYTPALILDKLAKIAAAWKYAKSTWNPKYVMKLDADDFISSKLVQWLDNADGEAGYLITHGWVWRSGSRYLLHWTELFDRTCGSCLIIRSDVADKTGPFLTEWEGVPPDEASSSLVASNERSANPESRISTLLLNDTCTHFATQFAYLGHSLPTVPFSAVVYRTGNADSVEGGIRQRMPQTQTLRMLIGRIRRTRLITKALRKEFMLG
jgi:hypothetical protein